MIQRLRHRVRPADDRGALLIIAIIIITVVALVTGAVLTQGEGSLRATVALRDVARASYAADGAAQVAINDLRTGYNVGGGEPNPWYYTNAVGTGCFGFDGAAGSTTPKDTLVLDNLIPKQGGDTQSAMSAAVKCTPEDATGDQGSAVPINNANKPGNAILTLGTSGAENGFTFKTNGSGAAFRVRGGVWSNSNIFRDNNGNLESTESIRANTGCTPRVSNGRPDRQLQREHCTRPQLPERPGHRRHRHPSAADTADQLPEQRHGHSAARLLRRRRQAQRADEHQHATASSTSRRGRTTSTSTTTPATRSSTPTSRPARAACGRSGGARPSSPAPSPQRHHRAGAVHQPHRRRQRQRGPAHLRWRQPDGQSTPTGRPQPSRSAGPITPAGRRSPSTGRRPGTRHGRPSSLRPSALHRHRRHRLSRLPAWR